MIVFNDELMWKSSPSHFGTERKLKFSRRTVVFFLFSKENICKNVSFLAILLLEKVAKSPLFHLPAETTAQTVTS